MRAVHTAADAGRVPSGRQGRDFVSCLKHLLEPLRDWMFKFTTGAGARVRARGKIIEVYFHGLHGLHGPTLWPRSAPGAWRCRRRLSAPSRPVIALTATEAAQIAKRAA